MSIPTFIISRERRTARKAIASGQFTGREEFSTTTLPLQSGASPAAGLWNTVSFIIKELLSHTDEYFILCNEDHQFTPHYNKAFLLDSIGLANKMNAAILCGGVRRIADFVKVADHLYWMDSFAGLQFTVLFRRFFETIGRAKFTAKDNVGHKINAITDAKFLIYPFISAPKGAAGANGEAGAKVVAGPEATIEFINRVTKFYRTTDVGVETAAETAQYENVFIPTYIINLPERKDRLASITHQFEGRDEFRTDRRGGLQT